MPDPGDLTPEQKSALDAWIRSSHEAITTQKKLTNEIDTFIRMIGPSGVGRGISTFTRGLSDTAMQLGRTKGATIEQQIQLQGLTRSFATAVEATTAFLTIMDSLEKKQGTLQRAYGLTNVSMRDYYSELISGADIAGTSGVRAGEIIVRNMLEQRRVSLDNREEFERLTKTFVLYSTALSENFPEDFVKMQQQLGMNVEDIASSYEKLGYNAANARVPFEQYKNSVIDTTSRFVQYGTTIDEVMGTFNLFMDDISKGTLTMGEAANAVNNILQVQKTAGGLQKRGMLAKYVGDEWGAIPEDIQKSLDATTQKIYGKSFREMGITQRQFALANLDTSQYTKIESAIFETLGKRFTPEQMMQVTPQIFTGEYFEMQRRAAAVETREAPTTITPDAFRKDILPRIAENQKEWYTFMSKIVLQLKGLIGDLSGVGKIVTSAGAGIAGAAVNTLPQMLMMRAIMGGAGTTGGIGGGVGLGQAGTALTKFAGVLGLATAAVSVWSFAINEIEKAGGFKKLGDDLSWWHDEFRNMIRGEQGTGTRYDINTPEERATTQLSGLVGAGFFDEALQMFNQVTSLRESEGLVDVHDRLRRIHKLEKSIPDEPLFGAYSAREKQNIKELEYEKASLVDQAKKGMIEGINPTDVNVNITVSSTPELSAKVEKEINRGVRKQERE